MEEEKESKEEIVNSENLIGVREPGFIYYLNGKGQACRKKKSGLKHKKYVMNKRKTFDFKKNEAIPKVLLDCYVSNRYKCVRKAGTSAVMSFPKELIDIPFRVILVPKQDETKQENIN